jgi:NAD(P)-dependent dehydrogenase (short-subunit alcohol dehydrogenase family)
LTAARDGTVDLGARIAGKSVLVTGGSSGLGRHFAELCARHGAKVAVAGRRVEMLAGLAEELRALGAADCLPVQLDVRDAASVRDAVAAANQRFGGLDVLVNNAGIVLNGPALDQPEEAFDAVLDTNLKGMWLAATEAARLWKAAERGGAIVNIASITGLRPAGNVAAYSVSKAAVVQMTKALAGEWARHGIRVNALAPGYLATDLNNDFLASDTGQALVRRIPMRRLGELSELDAPFLLLATDAGSFMTGSIVVVDGGHLVASL